MRRLFAILSISLGVALAAVAPAASAATPGPAQLPSIESQFMCVSCHEPLELVSSPQAQSEKAYIVSLLKKGENLSQIKTAMVAQYGPAVLARPPASGFNLTVYILPPVVLIAGLLLLAYTLPKWRRRSRLAAGTSAPVGPPLAPEQSERVNEELSRLI